MRNCPTLSTRGRLRIVPAAERSIMGHVAMALSRRPRSLRRGLGDIGGSAVGALTSIFQTMTVESAVTPTVTIDLQSGSSSGGPDLLSRFIQPTVRFYGPAGVVTIAPFGDSADSGPLPGLVVAAGGVATALAFMYLGHLIFK